MRNNTYRNIPRAELLAHLPGPSPTKGDLVTTLFRLRVPLDYVRPEAGAIELCARMVKSRNILESTEEALPIFVFLCGGPGTDNPSQRIPGLNEALVAGGILSESKCQILYLDYRGTGESTPVGVETLAKMGTPEEQAEYLSLFRQDNIVRDLEAVRKCLSFHFWKDESRPWSIMGQSYGGWVALTYLSFCPFGLSEVFLTGGLAPIGKGPDEVYLETYKQVSKQNTEFYKDPLNRVNVRTTLQYLASKVDAGQPVYLPKGGKLTVQRFMLLGRSFGSSHGLATVAGLVEDMAEEIRSHGAFTAATLQGIEDSVKFFGRPLYAALHEAIYCDGPRSGASNWAAERVGTGLAGDSGRYGWLRGGKYNDTQQDDVVFFAGEMIYPLHFEAFPELRPFAQVADVLARRADWPALYDEEALAANTVPVCAVGYTDDMYVSSRLGRETAAKVAGTRYFESPDLAHDAVRTDTKRVLGYFARMRKGLPALEEEDKPVSDPALNSGNGSSRSE